jgi:excisionase family DNA binding protein
MAELENGGAEERPRLLSIPQACRLLGIGRSSLYERLSSRQIRSVKLGRRRLVPREAVDEFVANLLTDTGWQE